MSSFTAGVIEEIITPEAEAAREFDAYEVAVLNALRHNPKASLPVLVRQNRILREALYNITRIQIPPGDWQVALGDVLGIAMKAQTRLPELPITREPVRYSFPEKVDERPVLTSDGDPVDLAIKLVREHDLLPSTIFPRKHKRKEDAEPERSPH
jgi:hypothetical protein